MREPTAPSDDILCQFGVSCEARLLPGESTGVFQVGSLVFKRVGRSSLEHDRSLDLVPWIAMCSPIGLAVDPFGRLHVADTSNDRVLEYDRPTDNGQATDRVLGQPDFATVGCDTGGVGARSMCGPAGVATDRLSNLYVADTDNARVLRFGGLPPLVQPSPVPTPEVPVQLPTGKRGK